MILYNPTGSHTTNSSLSSAVTITRGGDRGKEKLVIQVFTQNIRATIDGTTPTSTTGFQIPVGTIYEFDFPTDSTTLKIIEESSGAVVQYQWFQTVKDTE
jgi:ribosomal protein L24